MRLIQLQYGADRRYAWALPQNCAATLWSGPDEDIDVILTTRENLAQPLELPPLQFAMVPGDRVVLAVEREHPVLQHVVSALWAFLAEAGVNPADVTILQPAGIDPLDRRDPRALLPRDVAAAVQWKIHDPTDDDSCGYLASSAAGERIYLSRTLLDADFVIPISLAGFDPILGYKPPCGVFYPGLSNLEAFKKTHGQGHQELRPEDERPLRQLINEAGWLLGVQYGIQAVPSARRGQATEILAGSVEAVARRAQQILNEDWRISLPERVSTVIAAIPTDGREVSWSLLGSALHTARTLVERGGRIILLTDLSADPGPGIQMIREHRSARSALQPLRALGPEDLQAATQLASAADWASVYLLSNLDATLVEELFCTPLESESELGRLLETIDDCTILGAAQYVHGEIG